MTIITPRLELVAATAAMLAAEIADPQTLSGTMGAALPDDWPPGEYDHDAQQFFLSLIAANPLGYLWMVRYMITREDVVGSRVLVGALGFGGPPDGDGQVVMGYSVSQAHRQRGYANEAVQGMLAWAANDPALKCAIAEASPANLASVRILKNAGFVAAGEPSLPGMIRFERHFGTQLDQPRQ